MKLKTLLLSSVISLSSFTPSLADPNAAIGLAFGNSEFPPMRSSEFVDRALASFKRYAGSDDVFDARDERRLSPLAARLAAGFSKSDFERVKSLDLDQDGRVQKDEVQIWAMDAFDTYDANGNAVIDSNELQSLTKDLSPIEPMRLTQTTRRPSLYTSRLRERHPACQGRHPQRSQRVISLPSTGPRCSLFRSTRQVT